MTRRIHHLTGTHFDNGEDIQIVRYEPGQFYRVHHDQNTAVWAPQGPRVLTFFMYLNTPEGGGETWFPQVNDVNGSRGVMVQPRAGSAVLYLPTSPYIPLYLPISPVTRCSRERARRCYGRRPSTPSRCTPTTGPTTRPSP